MEQIEPICECSNPACSEPLGITWEEWRKRNKESRGSVQIAPTCQSNVGREGAAS